MDIQKIQTPYTIPANPPVKHSPWFIGLLVAVAVILMGTLSVYVYREYTKPEAQVKRALEKVAPVDPVPIQQEAVDRALGRVTRAKPIILDQKAIQDAMNKLQK
ncbi:MAG: hypothetical protein RLZZ347_514 [Candidatus Parcubacteria bacterium]|jgi:hypothetical protein